ncbi:HAMP domain-containing sensor histidine kinase [Liquorilactobacillus mali]|uniref:histidine kinase n=1 Tax=Liquorilactobacillus mali TaxID=1618 RepID=A0A0R2FMS7_9LACO|nr:HAMP domain-containing sensor histidine kinase [Liquorilactobacillus mali]KRN29889.1 sensor histidine kinase [Liquorilactobacillus mali]MDN7145969.1 HAMP domain-containing sensor histidine kinase [Liquorilactobacillus mali]
MIQKIRYSFIYMSTVALFIVLVTLTGSIVGVSYYRAKQQINNVLIILLQNNGKIDAQINTQNVRKRFGPTFNQESLYQYRYFSVSFNSEGKQVALDNSHIVSVPRETIASLGYQVFKSKQKSGTVRSEVSSYAYKTQKKNGRTTIVFLDQSVIMESTNNIMKIGLILGITSLILFTLMLIAVSKRAIRPIVLADKRQREFVTNAGHELKTPLSIIKANNELQEMTTGQTEWTISNEQQVDRLTKLINNLISLARLEEQQRLNLSVIEASEILEHATNSFKSVVSQENKKLKITISPSLRINAEENSFLELCNILLDNANKYCDDGGTVSVAWVPDKKLKKVTLMVGNTYAKGKSINYSKFFERFYRNDKSRNSAKKGFGIGLSMAANIVDAFNGKIGVSYQKETIFFRATFKLVR